MYDDKKWSEKYKLAKKYYKENGNLLIPSSYIINGVNLGRWIINERRNKKIGKMPHYRKVLLDEIGMVWNYYEDSPDEKWLIMYREALIYYKKYNNIDVPFTYSYIKDNKEVKLGNWIINQRVNFNDNKLSQNRIDLLNKIGMKWKLRVRYSWDEMYKLAKDYYLENNNLLIPTTYEVTFNNEEISLGNWIANQRRQYNLGKLSSDRIKLLNDIKMKWKDVREVQTDRDWLITFKHLLKYYSKSGYVIIPKDYKVEVEDKLISLNSWYKHQTSLCSKGELTGKRKDMFSMFLTLLNEDIKNANDLKWMKYYKVAVKYYNVYGNLKVPSTYEINIDGEIIKLGQWINSQRSSYRGQRSNISEERINLLNNIGMIWNIRENKLVKEI